MPWSGPASSSSEIGPERGSTGSKKGLASALGDPEVCRGKVLDVCATHDSQTRSLARPAVSESREVDAQSAEAVMLAGNLALVSAALFTGAAFYINFAEHPARMGLEDRPRLAQWKLSYKQGLIMQLALVIIGFLLGPSLGGSAGVFHFCSAGCSCSRTGHGRYSPSCRSIISSWRRTLYPQARIAERSWDGGTVCTR